MIDTINSLETENIPTFACISTRSKVPDLLFEDVKNSRILDINPYLEEPEEVDEWTPLHRVTVFLTYSCNLDCPYCKTIARSDAELRMFPQKRVHFNSDSFENYLLSLKNSPIKHLHFTGGEAALIPGLPDMVKMARNQGIEHLSITSNGTLAPHVYERLVRSGMNEIRISIDAREASMGALLTGRQSAWRRAVENLRALNAMRSEFPELFLIANSVISSVNREDIVEIVRFLISLGVNDIKLIMMVQEKESLGDFPKASQVQLELKELLRAYPEDAFPLLRRKVLTVFDTEAIGLEDVRGQRKNDWRCFIPLTERTVDSVYYYPCSVYLREGGAPLGLISEPGDTQREKTADFVRNGNCLEDKICRQYCLHCTKAYNVSANESRE